MHPASIIHLGTEYALGHLFQRLSQFAWTDDGQEMGFSIRIRYSPHCYSEEAIPPFPEGGYVIEERNRQRLFCPIRHGHSLSLPDIVDGLFTKPTTRVAFTPESNWSVFRLAMTPPLDVGHKYYVFFRVKLSDPNSEETEPYCLDLFIESAYQRDQGVKALRQFPFGKVAARAAKRVHI